VDLQPLVPPSWLDSLTQASSSRRAEQTTEEALKDLARTGARMAAPESETQGRVAGAGAELAQASNDEICGSIRRSSIQGAKIGLQFCFDCRGKIKAIARVLWLTQQVGEFSSVTYGSAHAGRQRGVHTLDRSIEELKLKGNAPKHCSLNRSAAI